MSAAPPLNPRSPKWEYLIAHHLPSRFNRTIQVTVGPRELHFCARCTGQVLGVIAWIGAFALLERMDLSFFDPRYQAVFAVLPVVAAWDWITQSVGRRESGNSLRVVSGILLGAAFVDLLALLVTGRWTMFAGGVLIMIAYFAVLLLILRATGAWRRVLVEHFPGIDLGPASSP